MKGLGLAASIALLAFVIISQRPVYSPLVYAPSVALDKAWNTYKSTYVIDSRTQDSSRDNVTTSEGQSYSMLRATWQGDKSTFDSLWTWTKSNLQHKDDHLFSWLFGKKPDGSYGVLTDRGGDVSASDADGDIALSLVFAYAQWGDKQYLTDARAIIKDIWDKEVVEIKGNFYLVSNNLEKQNQSDVLVNPSYFSPASYRIFLLVDPTTPWVELAADTYDLIENSIQSPIGGDGSGLPPDWVRVSRTDASLSVPQNLTTNFGFDAMRAPWRIALDYQWFGTPRAKEILSKIQLDQVWQEQKKLVTTYTHNREPLNNTEAVAMYGATLGYFEVEDAHAAEEIYRTKMIPLYNPAKGWSPPLSYYDDNWAWFGVSLYNHALKNLAAGKSENYFSP